MKRRTGRSAVREAMLDYVARSATESPDVGTAKLSSKHQITLPMEAVRRLGLEPGDRLVVRLEDQRIVLKPRPRDWVEYYQGRLRGVYGNTKEEIDEYVRRERASWRNRPEFGAS